MFDILRRLQTHTCGMALLVAGDWLEEPFLPRSRPEFVETLTGESTVSGNLSVTMEVLEAGCSAGVTPFTSTGSEGS